jgi:hypothetical protein
VGGGEGGGEGGVGGGGGGGGVGGGGGAQGDVRIDSYDDRATVEGSKMNLQQITLQPKIGSGEVAGPRVMTPRSEEQTVARQSAGTCVKSPSASAPGVDSLSSLSIPSTTKAPGVGGSTPSFCAAEIAAMRMEIEAAGLDELTEYERLQEERFQIARESMMRAIRMEAERKSEARARAAKLETDIECLRINRDVWRFIAVLPWIIFPVMWVVTR